MYMAKARIAKITWLCWIDPPREADLNYKVRIFPSQFPSSSGSQFLRKWNQYVSEMVQIALIIKYTCTHDDPKKKMN